MSSFIFESFINELAQKPSKAQIFQQYFEHFGDVISEGIQQQPWYHHVNSLPCKPLTN